MSKYRYLFLIFIISCASNSDSAIDMSQHPVQALQQQLLQTMFQPQPRPLQAQQLLPTMAVYQRTMKI